MRGLYFRIILGVFIVLILAFTLPEFAFRLFGPDERTGGMPMLMTGLTELLRDRLNKTDPAHLDKTLDSLAAGFDFPVRLVEAADRSLPAMSNSGAVTRQAQGGYFDQQDIFAASLGNSNRVLVVGPIPAPPRPSARHIVILVALVLSLAGVTGFFMIAPLVRGLRSLETAATKFGDGDLDSRAPAKSQNAVGGVARQFNRMAERIQRLIERERQLLQSVSHELRTPIARIRFNLEMLRDARTRDEQQQRAREIDTEISEVDQLVGELLDYNRVHAEGTAIARQSVAVRQLLEEVVQRLHDFRSGVDIEILTGDDAPGEANVDRLLFRRAMENLVANALRFATEDVTITYRRDGESMVVEVCDDGPGIPAEQRELILRPFYRGEAAGDGKSGVGLGLAIVQRIVEMHGGRIGIEDAEMGGAKFVTRWPNAAPSGKDF